MQIGCSQGKTSVVAMTTYISLMQGEKVFSTSSAPGLVPENYNEARVLINPVIISKEGLTDYWEACASCLDNIGHVKRPYKIIIKYR